MSVMHDVGMLDCVAVEPRESFWQAMRRTVVEWNRRMKGRNELSRLDELDLRDIGVTRADAMREAGKPFWQA